MKTRLGKEEEEEEEQAGSGEGRGRICTLAHMAGIRNDRGGRRTDS